MCDDLVVIQGTGYFQARRFQQQYSRRLQNVHWSQSPELGKLELGKKLPEHYLFSGQKEDAKEFTHIPVENANISLKSHRMNQRQ